MLNRGRRAARGVDSVLQVGLLGHTSTGKPLEVRLAARDGARWAALVLGVPGDGSDPALVPTDARPAAPPVAAGERIGFAGGLGATVLGRHEAAARVAAAAACSMSPSGPGSAVVS